MSVYTNLYMNKIKRIFRTMDRCCSVEWNSDNHKNNA